MKNRPRNRDVNRSDADVTPFVLTSQLIALPPSTFHALCRDLVEVDEWLGGPSSKIEPYTESDQVLVGPDSRILVHSAHLSSAGEYEVDQLFTGLYAAKEHYQTRWYDDPYASQSELGDYKITGSIVMISCDIAESNYAAQNAADRHIHGHQWEASPDNIDLVTGSWIAKRLALHPDVGEKYFPPPPPPPPPPQPATPILRPYGRLDNGEVIKGTSEYEVLNLIGSGGVADVYRIRDSVDRSIYAAKVLHGRRFSIDPRTIQRFQREFAIQRRIRHPNVIQPLDLTDHRGMPVLIMEYAEGGSLASRLRDPSQHRPIKVAMLWIRQIVNGVSAIHRLRFVHRDLTPKNILFKADGQLAVADFGIARQPGDTTLTASRDQIGSLIYISPQQRANPHRAKRADDVFSMGQIFFEIVTGLSPHGAYGSARQFRQSCPLALSDFIEELRSFKRSSRPVDAMRAGERLAEVEG